MTATLDGTNGLSFDVGQPITNVSAINSGYLYGNRIKNANKLYASYGTSGTVVAGTAVPTSSTGYYTTDRFYSYCTGANVTLAQVAGVNPTYNYDQFTGAASVTTIGHGTRLEARDTAHMAGTTCTYSVELANSLLTTVTWTAYYASTANTFGTVGTPTKTQIATGSFTVNSTVTKYSTQIALPAGATTGVEIVLTVGAQTSGTWTIGREDFRTGSVSPTYFEVPDPAQELIRCQRYCETGTSYIQNDYQSTSAASFGAGGQWQVSKFATPTVTIGNTTGTANTTGGTVTPLSITSYYVRATGIASSGGTSSQIFQASWTAKAEIP